MQYISTRGKNKAVSFKEAVFRGLAEDGGLYVPAVLPKLPAKFLNDFRSLSFQEICLTLAGTFIGDDMRANDLREIIESAIDFDAPLHFFSGRMSGLELFHGPTLAFKDFGARFMARVMSHLHHDSKDLLLLVATSGDTGAAVAHGFWRVPGIHVVIAYPSGQVSEIQEQQFSTLGDNITALEVQGTFDDCQSLVKQAFADPEIARDRNLTSANSINIARLIPQTFYYWQGCAQLPHPVDCISVPSGNYGNLTAGLIAKMMGLPVKHFVAASNVNDVVPRFLKTGSFHPKPSIRTISNSMDVGHPSNWERILFLYNGNRDALLQDLSGHSFTDEETRNAIREVFEHFTYILDPHSAVAYLGLKTENRPGVFVQTAHPAKFPDIIGNTINAIVPVPESLLKNLHKQKLSVPIAARFSDFRSFLLNL